MSYNFYNDWRTPGDIWVKTPDGWQRLLDLQNNPAPMDIDEPVADDVEVHVECQEGAVGGAEVWDVGEEEFPENVLEQVDDCSNICNQTTNRNANENKNDRTKKQILQPKTHPLKAKQAIKENNGNRNKEPRFKDLLEAKRTVYQNAYKNKYAEQEPVLHFPRRDKQDVPHIFLKRGNPWEKQIMMGLSDAFRKLDFNNKAKNVAQFRYICKVLELIFKYKFGDLGGTGQKGIFTVLECALSHVLSTQTHMSIFKEILQHGSDAMAKGKYYNFVSPKLWSQHTSSIKRMLNEVNSIQFKEYSFGDKTNFTELADGCVFKILHCLSDHQDIINTGSINSRFFSLSKSVALWRDLCHYHFTNQMIETQIAAMPDICLNEMTQENWEQVYRKLQQKHGSRVEYGDTLELCCHCNALHWKSLGHPCLMADSDVKEETIPVDPKRCVELLMGKWMEIPTKILSVLN